MKRSFIFAPLSRFEKPEAKTIFGIIYIEEKKDEGKYKLFMEIEREKRVNFESDPERRTNGKRKKRKEIYNEEFDPGSG